MLVPIAVLVPAMLVFIPPLMSLTPAAFSRIVQFATLVICPFAVASVSLDCLVEFMFRVNDSTLTPVEVFCVESWHCREKQSRRQYGSCEHRCCCDKKIVRTIHTISLTLSLQGVSRNPSADEAKQRNKQ
jgi:hypothetical protein